MRALDHPTPSTPRRKGFLHACLAALVIVLVACTGAQPTANSSPTVGGPVPTPAVVQFPRTVTDDEGTELTLTRQPESIVSLTPAATELIFALGLGDRLRGGTDFDDYPREAVALPDVATFTGVLIEDVVDIDPDLVIAGGNNFTSAEDINRLRDLGLTVLVVYAATVDEVLQDIELIGRATGAEQAAQDIVRQMDSRIDGVIAELEGLGRPRVFYEIGNTPEIYGPAPGSFVADMVELAGGEPITTTDPAVFSIPVERLIAEDPEIIVLGDAAYGVCPDNVLARPGWGSITAVRNGAIRPVDDIIVTRPGPRLGEGLAALALAIHPEVDIAPPEARSPLCSAGPGAAPAATDSPVPSAVP